MIHLRLLNRTVEFDDSQAEILALLELVKQHIGEHKIAWRYYQKAREKLLTSSDTMGKKEYNLLQRQLIELYSMLLVF